MPKFMVPLAVILLGAAAGVAWLVSYFTTEVTDRAGPVQVELHYPTPRPTPTPVPTSTPDPAAPAAYAAVSPDATFDAMEFLSVVTGSSSATLVVSVPSGSADSHIGFAVRPDLDPSDGLSDMRETGSGFNSRGAFAPAAGTQGVVVEIDGQDYHVYVSLNLWYAARLGRGWTLQ